MKDTLHYLLMANHLTFQKFLLTAIKNTELTPGQPKVLDFLRNHNGAVQKEIAEAMGCFEKIDDVPKYALTLTIPTLMSAKYNFCVVPAKTKAEAVKKTVFGEVSEECPASILRTKDNSILYCDSDSSSLIKDLIK